MVQEEISLLNKQKNPPATNNHLVDHRMGF